MIYNGTVFWDANNIKWLILQSFENNDYIYRACNLNKGILSEAKGTNLKEILTDIENIEETKFIYGVDKQWGK